MSTPFVPPQKHPHISVISTTDKRWAQEMTGRVSRWMQETRTQPFHTLAWGTSLYPGEVTVRHTELIIVDCRGLNGQLISTAPALTHGQLILAGPDRTALLPELEVGPEVGVQTCDLDINDEELYRLLDIAARGYNENACGP